MDDPGMERQGGTARGSARWSTAALGRAVPAEVGEWLSFAVRPDPAAETPLRALFSSYELYAASEGYPAVSELALVRHLEALGVRRRGATFLGLTIHSEIPTIRLLTRLEAYGYRFASRDGRLAWRPPVVVSDLERRTIARHERQIAAVLEEIASRRDALLGQRATTPPVRLVRPPLRAA